MALWKGRLPEMKNMRSRYLFAGVLLLLTATNGSAGKETYVASAGTKNPGANQAIRGVYFGSNRMWLDKKAAAISELIDRTEVNAVVLDVKDDSGFTVLEERYRIRIAELIRRYKAQDAYIICRIVAFKDIKFARNNPDFAVKHKNGSLWKDNLGNHWIDPASEKLLEHVVRVSRQAVELGCDELNFDYVRFPSDGNLEDINYPLSGKEQKRDVLDRFFSRLTATLKREHPGVPLSVDIFGYVFLTGRVPEVGQYLEVIVKYFDIISPMAYPSHFKCNSFGVRDPNTAPYRVYAETLKSGMTYLERSGLKPEIRPWLQAFSIANTSGCGGRVEYGRANFREQIRALKDLGINGWMAWNPGAEYPEELFDK